VIIPQHTGHPASISATQHLSSVRDYVAQTDTFDLPLVLIAAYCCFATPSMSTPVMSTPATWYRDVHSRDFSAPVGVSYEMPLGTY